MAEGKPVSFIRTAMQAVEAFRMSCRLRKAGFFRELAAFGGIVAASLTVATATQDANANGETRSLTMFHSHTNESLTVTYKRNGSFDSGALEKLNWFLRDWRVDEPISMAPQLFDVIWYAYREVGASDPIRIMSAYRSPGTNAMLRRRSRAVAKESQHMRGNAMDIHIPGVSMAKVREIGMRLQRGGVGYYPSAGSPFVHLDVGSVRSWPRMPRDQLERMFPDGKTVHLPADGIPLANYQAALAEVQARGGSALDYGTVTSNSGKSLWALLFGGDEDEDARQPAVRGRNTRVAAGRGRGAPPPEQVASITSGDNVMSAGVVAYAPTPAPRTVRSVPVATPAAEAVVEPTPVSRPATPSQVAAAQTALAQAAPARIEPQLQIASLPVPPIRPRGAQLERLIAAAEPLPPIRPSGLTALVASLPVSSLPAAATPPLQNAAETPAPPASAPVVVAGMPLPPLRPAAAAPGAVVAAVAVPIAAPQAVNLPAPPIRPALPAGASPQVALPAIVSRRDVPTPNPAVTQAYAAISAPLPPSRPVPQAAKPESAKPETARPVAVAPAVTPQPAAPVPVLAPAPAPARSARVSAPPKATNPNALLATRPEAQTRPRSMTAVAEPPVEREVKSGVVAMKFGTAPAGVSSGSGGFGGAFVRPLGASFTKSGE